MKNRIILFACLALAVATFGCKKKTHKIIAALEEGKDWTIDEMAYFGRYDGSTIIDTVISAAGTFNFRQDKRRDEHGTGTITRVDLIDGVWESVTEEFVWTSEDDALRIVLTSGPTENIEIIENRRRDQQWISSETRDTLAIERNYFLSKVLE